VAHWRQGQLILESYARAVQIEASPLVLDVLDRFSTWETFEAVARQLSRIPADLLQALVDSLVEHGALETPATSSPWDAWSSWSPAASFFHQSTKDVPFTPRDETNRRLKARAVHDPIPPPLKPPYYGPRIPLPPPHGGPRIGLPPPRGNQHEREAGGHASGRRGPAGTAALQTSGRGADSARQSPQAADKTLVLPAADKTLVSPAADVTLVLPKTRGALTASDFPDVLLSRRTWRRFGTRALRLDELSTLLGLTWGVQAWMVVEGWGRMALKTAPSGGARHSIEAYVLVRRVDGLAPGLYHYQPASHELHQVRAQTARASRAAIGAYLPRQTFYGNASALMLMSAVFARAQWRYAFARAYRTVLAEAGHHAQTFCLIATWLGLAPFCTMALADSRIEADLGIDGVGESVLYATGVGPRPADTSWAPWPRAGETSTRTANALGISQQRPRQPPRKPPQKPSSKAPPKKRRG